LLAIRFLSLWRCLIGRAVKACREKERFFLFFVELSPAGFSHCSVTCQRPNALVVAGTRFLRLVRRLVRWVPSSLSRWISEDPTRKRVDKISRMVPHASLLSRECLLLFFLRLFFAAADFLRVRLPRDETFSARHERRRDALCISPIIIGCTPIGTMALAEMVHFLPLRQWMPGVLTPLLPPTSEPTPNAPA